MSLKRKASFSAVILTDVAPVIAGPSRVVDNSPKHLHSRTRKRFRNDRPEDRVIYENTLRWLFTAQQHPHGPAPPIDEDVNMDSEPLPPSEIVDPRQQTLHKFFQPSQSSFFHTHPNSSSRQMNAISQPNDILSQRDSLNTASPFNSIRSATSIPTTQSASTDMDMDSGSDESAQEPKTRTGVIGWM